jgi:hypothetical protein
MSTATQCVISSEPQDLPNSCFFMFETEIASIIHSIGIFEHNSRCWELNGIYRQGCGRTKISSCKTTSVVCKMNEKSITLGEPIREILTCQVYWRIELASWKEQKVQFLC